ncbi:MAG: hypothetical protein Sv326_1248 [Candidatus Fermentimicrarchaeum limneticum]|uniref:Uncharacterized protein n=1 Tax=Fermentimicrarchaeum limneticum TaxID=2795018 RepID=A0A7D6BR48_FERL1|nr:MAG: hypothetical protein Sv326_1248 [Candidatus Fermentimicrarchaeum limneticum]
MKKASGALTKKTFKLNQSEFWSGFIKGLATGLLTLLLWYLTYSFLMRAEVFTLALLFVGEWLLPVCIFHVTMKKNSEKMGLLVSHYCIFLLGMLYVAFQLI